MPNTELHTHLSIIVPMLNEIELLPDLLAHLRTWRSNGCEVLLVDGGSHDGSADVAEAIGFSVVRTSRGRARQMNAGAAQATGNVLVFLHADSRLPEQADAVIVTSLAATGRHWGRFDVNITGNALMLQVVAWFMNRRSRLTGIATGDQAIFVDKSLFDAVGGFPEQLLMEDIELCLRLRRLSPPLCLKQQATTSGRRWLEGGIWQTIWLMWRLRWKYWRGVPAEQLAREYR